MTESLWSLNSLGELTRLDELYELKDIASLGTAPAMPKLLIHVNMQRSLRYAGVVGTIAEQLIGSFTGDTVLDELSRYFPDIGRRYEVFVVILMIFSSVPLSFL
jgi:hypothetical protein